MSKSLLDHAYDFVSSKDAPVSFADIWAYVVEAENLSEQEAADKVARFYTNLMFDGRFVTLGENQWDLRARHTFDKVHIDMKDVYAETDDDGDVDVEEEDEDDKAYNNAFKETSEESEEESSKEESEEEDL